MKIMKKAELREALKTKTRGENWSYAILRYLANRPEGATKIEIYRATRPDRLEIPETKMSHNVASQFSYIEVRDQIGVLEKINDRYKLVGIDESVAKQIGVTVK